MTGTLIWLLVASVVLVVMTVVLRVLVWTRGSKINRMQAPDLRGAAHARDQQLKREKAKAAEADPAARTIDPDIDTNKHGSV